MNEEAVRPNHAPHLWLDGVRVAPHPVIGLTGDMREKGWATPPAGLLIVAVPLKTLGGWTIGAAEACRPPELEGLSGDEVKPP